MKKILLLVCVLGSIHTYAQYSYSFSIADILNNGTPAVKAGSTTNPAPASGSMTLPNGLVVTAHIIGLGNGVPEPGQMGYTGPSLGGTFTGGSTNCISGYTGSTDPLMFTNISSGPCKIANGVGSNCKNAVGFWIHFSEPITLDPFLTLDLDGEDAHSNKEWEGAFAFNNTEYVPCSYTYNTSGGKISPQVISLTNSWLPWITANIGNTDIPSNFTILRRNSSSLNNSSPDNINTQILFTLPLNKEITDFVVLWGVWDNKTGCATSDVQNSGLSPIVINLPTLLPLKLANFSGSIQKNEAQLNWKTTEEVNTKSFEIEYSADGKTFTRIGELSAIGMGENNYSFVDKTSELLATNYYRLKMNDADGKFTYSRIIEIKTSTVELAGISIWPNPVNDVLNIKFPNLKSAVDIGIFDASGKKVIEHRNIFAETKSIKCSNLASGFYYITITDNTNKTKTLRFVKN